jgi:hypothetical protein
MIFEYSVNLRDNCFYSLFIWLCYELVGKLVLKIPWKNIYSAPVEASVEGLFLLVVPQQEVKYDPDKEEKSSQDAKKAELQRVEDKKKQEQEKGEIEIILLLRVVVVIVVAAAGKKYVSNKLI